MNQSRLLFLASWVILVVVSTAILLFSLASTMRAYSGATDNLTPTLTTERMRESGDDAVNAFRGRRVTAATSALAYSILSLFVVVVPYRRAERWAWWAILFSVGLSQLLSVARLPVIGASGGAGTSGIVLSFFLLGLMAGAPRILFPHRGSD